MDPVEVIFTGNAQLELADILYFHIFHQETPLNIAKNINNSIRNKTMFLLSNLPNGGQLARQKNERVHGHLQLLYRYSTNSRR
jgi:hypothetical protein